ncbi:hypothetical protein KFL_003270040 [Klebsormidium nitens]|uniref:Uncharacterized protein n=1 Tax=Klebsormidium nitens TaxID=105231 RepID=A0A1Y1IE92_KLENI|nr:hypothetical protein KFL_003270040 [Klebsormidium nitens]|eukprot:GAQ87037.1 hypothetical protein KFL_003270040 [Klebsormidium nitens]
MVLIVLFLPFLVIAELRRANHASHCYFYHVLPDMLMIEKYFRTRTQDFSLPLLQHNTDQPATGVLEVSLFALKGLAASLLAACTNRKNRRWQPACFKFELQFGDVVYCSNPHTFSTQGDTAFVDFNHRIAFQVTRGMAPELRVKVYGCRTRKLTHGVKLKAVLGTASVDLSALVTVPEPGADVTQMSLSVPLSRRNEGGREQAQVDLLVSYRHNPDVVNQIVPWNAAAISDGPGGLPVTGPDGAVWVAHPSPCDTPGESNRKYGVEDKEELGSYSECGPASLTLGGRDCRQEGGGPRSSIQNRRLSDTGHPVVHTTSGLENGVGVLGL